MAAAKVSPEDLLSRIEAHTAPLILDVRSAPEYDAGHVPGAVHLPFYAIGARAAEIPASKEDLLVVYCQHGPRAWLAAAALRRHGFSNIAYLRGHMRRWHAAQLPEERVPPRR